MQRAIQAGDDVTGASTFLIEEGLDTGPVIGQATERIRPTDTAGEVLTRLASHGRTATEGLAGGPVLGCRRPVASRTTASATRPN